MSTQTEEIIATASAGSNIPPHPEGQFAAKCIDVIDRGIVETTWQGKTKRQHKITLRFWCGEYAEVEGEDGLRQMPLWVDAWFTLTLDDRGNLRPFLENWRGQKFTAAEEKGFNVAKLLGANAFIQVSHNVKPNKTYANIDSIMKLPKGVEAVAPLDGYVRVKDRPTEDGGHPENSSASPFEDEDDGLPF